MILLDTHTFVWWIGNPEFLSIKAKQEIDKAKNKREILVSSISVWEICLLVTKKRLKLTMDVETWIEKVEELSVVKFVPIDNKIAIKSTQLLDPFHKDPADRIIVASALENGATLITSDKKILEYPFVKTLW
ncbi:twitching motility protein PilT [Candidatus Woesebacteria bacterium RIFCSPHIGHO2_01_FULL_39_28]|uniref:Twitching motility protein PilT n=1 Tax=Candidatus Woesebacteria bacterium RIFCSPHIGHO2_01_FULL_39_28 TaxID=1802496 RepID=A0A1F7YHR7_9BACT|nr:MAG: twitching motility protein PilT [Candidatus Woesebacteria bacterium RIFCSPHIGHO2_01_FULL_39_28]OGM56660.1 MAG: twitching motility protein PilT [Candidatus Woesebacteria bacterium RIFCSPLOWO2_01_FULL_38_20]